MSSNCGQLEAAYHHVPYSGKLWQIGQINVEFTKVLTSKFLILGICMEYLQDGYRYFELLLASKTFVLYHQSFFWWLFCLASCLPKFFSQMFVLAYSPKFSMTKFSTHYTYSILFTSYVMIY